MRPRGLFWLSLTALVILMSSLIIPAVPIIGCLMVNGATPTSCTTTIAVTVFISTFLVIVGGLLATAAWIIGLVFAAQREDWGWFAAVLLLTPIATLIYSRKLGRASGNANG